MITVLKRSWNEPHPPRNTANEAFDRMSVKMTANTFRGIAYLTEVVTCNNEIVVMNQYPAETDYARRRIEKWTR